MSKKCPKCGSGDVYVKVLYPYHSVNLACCRACGHLGEEPEFTITTVFDRITASPEVLAESSVYFEEEHTLVLEGSDCSVTFPGGWTSPFIEYKYRTKPEAIVATVEKLKEVCDDHRI